MSELNLMMKEKPVEEQRKLTYSTSMAVLTTISTSVFFHKDISPQTMQKWMGGNEKEVDKLLVKDIMAETRANKKEASQLVEGLRGIFLSLTPEMEKKLDYASLSLSVLSKKSQAGTLTLAAILLNSTGSKESNVTDFVNYAVRNMAAGTMNVTEITKMEQNTRATTSYCEKAGEEKCASFLEKILYTGSVDEAAKSADAKLWAQCKKEAIGQKSSFLAELINKEIMKSVVTKINSDYSVERTVEKSLAGRKKNENETSNMLNKRQEEIFAARMEYLGKGS